MQPSRPPRVKCWWHSPEHYYIHLSLRVNFRIAALLLRIANGPILFMDASIIAPLSLISSHACLPRYSPFSITKIRARAARCSAVREMKTVRPWHKLREVAR